MISGLWVLWCCILVRVSAILFSSWLIFGLTLRCRVVPWVHVKLPKPSKIQSLSILCTLPLTVQDWLVEFVTGKQDALITLLVNDDVWFRGYLKLYVQIHDMHDQVQLAKVDLIFQQGIAMSRHLDIEFIFHVLCNFRVFKSLQVLHSLKHWNVAFVMR